eukprot:351934-Chlamydomonas_euryale.AAC.1
MKTAAFEVSSCKAVNRPELKVYPVCQSLPLCTHTHDHRHIHATATASTAQQPPTPVPPPPGNRPR